MTRDVDSRLERLQERIEESDDISSSDREALTDFDNRLALLGSQYSAQRREKLLRHCVRIAEEVGGLADTLEDKLTPYLRAVQLCRRILRNPG